MQKSISLPRRKFAHKVDIRFDLTAEEILADIVKKRYTPDWKPFTRRVDIKF